MTRKPYEIDGLSLVVRDRDGGADAIGFLTLGEAYLVAAEKLVSDERSFIPTVGSPESLLTGHALELLLKSFLLACGVPVDDLKQKVGHKLRKCLKKAEDKGISKIAPVSPYLREAVNILSDEYSEKHFEYFLGTGRAVRTDLRQLLLEIRKVYEALESVYLGALKRHR